MEPVGVLAGVILLVQTIISVYFAGRNRRGDAAFRWRKRMEPKHLAALDYIYEVRMQAAKEGRRLPPLPPELAADDEDDDPPSDLGARRRRHERAP